MARDRSGLKCRTVRRKMGELPGEQVRMEQFLAAEGIANIGSAARLSTRLRISARLIMSRSCRWPRPQHRDGHSERRRGIEQEIRSSARSAIFMTAVSVISGPLTRIVLRLDRLGCAH